ncbi:NADPH-dependent FMN reductase [Hyphomonas sp.]|uniref:NADPH-dependent FMN reductase n=1 Tax=Hyphomonas sp. TaxID=87 RepID=UPI0030F8401B
MTHILAVSGSLRKASFNTGLMRAAEQVAPDGVSMTGMTLHGIPLYDGDEEAAHGLPEAVIAFKDAIAKADGLLLVTPEYNNGIPGVFKNGVDWASRETNAFRGKPVAIIGASPGGFGTILGQNHWLPVVRTLGMRPWFDGRLMVSRAGEQFDNDGNLTDESTRERLRELLAGFAAFVAL